MSQLVWGYKLNKLISLRLKYTLISYYDGLVGPDQPTALHTNYTTYRANI